MGKQENGYPEAVVTEESTPITHPTIAVMRIPGPEPGSERIEIMELNGMDPLSVPTVLRIAAKIKEQQLGVEGR